MRGLVGALISAILVWLVVSVAAQQRTPVATSPTQTIRFQPIDRTHVRLRLEGRENMIVDSAEFNVVPDVDVVRMMAAPGPNAITAAGSTKVSNTFALSVTVGVRSDRVLELSDLG
jgi:hypothetical protein